MNAAPMLCVTTGERMPSKPPCLRRVISSNCRSPRENLPGADRRGEANPGSALLSESNQIPDPRRDTTSRQHDHDRQSQATCRAALYFQSGVDLRETVRRKHDVCQKCLAAHECNSGSLISKALAPDSIFGMVSQQVTHEH